MNGGCDSVWGVGMAAESGEKGEGGGDGDTEYSGLDGGIRARVRARARARVRVRVRVRMSEWEDWILAGQ